jgi:hypothetical protein
MNDREAAGFWRLWGDDKDNPPEQLTWAQAAKIIQDLLVEPDTKDTKAQFDAVMKAYPQGPAAIRAALEPWRPKREEKLLECLTPKPPKIQ